MSEGDDLAGYRAEIREIEDRSYQQYSTSGRIIGTSMWSHNRELLQSLDLKHGVLSDDPRVYSIKAFKTEREQIEREYEKVCLDRGWTSLQSMAPEARQEWWSVSNRFSARKDDCFARHFPELNSLADSTVDTPRKLWAHITKHLIIVAEFVYGTNDLNRDTPHDFVESVYSLMHKLNLPGAPTPPYPKFKLREAGDELRRIANQLEAHDANVSRVFQSTPSDAKAIYISYAWGDDLTEAGRQRGEVVERLCDKLNEWGHEIVRDKDRLRNGDLVSKFMQDVGRGNRVLVILSEKYLHSPNCMTELFYVYQRSIGDKDEFLRRVIPVVVDDARSITNWRERARYADHWQREFKEMEPQLSLLGVDDQKQYRLVKQWHGVIGDILGFISDKLHPHGFDNIVKDDFTAVRELLEKNDDT